MTCISRCQCRTMLIHNLLVDHSIVRTLCQNSNWCLDTIRLSMELSRKVSRWAELPTRTQNHTSHKKNRQSNMTRSLNKGNNCMIRSHRAYNLTNKVCNTSLRQIRNHFHTKCKSLLDTNLCLRFDNLKANQRSHSHSLFDYFSIVKIRHNYRC